MSLTLSGQLGSAQLGAAELGALQTVTTGAGFPIFFPDSGPLKTAEPPKKKKPKKVKKPKQPKKQKAPKPVIQPDVTASEALAAPIPAIPDVVTLPPVFTISEQSASDISAAIQAVDTAQRRLRETIAEEDELLLIGCL